MTIDQTGRRTRIAFLYIAEAYQCYHGAAVALALAARPDVRVVSYYNDPETPAQLERVRLAYGAPPMEYRALRRSPMTRAMQSIRVLGMFKNLVMWDNRAELDGYDAIFTLEDTVASARWLGIRRPKLIYSPHGFGDRARGFVPAVRTFDFVLVPGPRIADRMLAEGLIRADGHALTGPVKLETSERLRPTSDPLFEERRPIVLYNAHKAPGLSSWPRFIEPMLAQFAGQDAFNLVVAPHTKLFRRRRLAVRKQWESRSTRSILIDTGSDRSLDMSYTAAADIYVGDVSSQVYEFLAVPRPCVFLNAGRVAWRDDPSYAHWHLGDVIDDPREIMAAVRAAPARHALYRARQEEQARASLGDRSPYASKRAADAVMGFLQRRERPGSHPPPAPPQDAR